jgi:trypsin
MTRPIVPPARASLRPWTTVAVALVAIGILVLAIPTSAVSAPKARGAIAGGYYPSDDAWPWTTALINPTRPGNDFDRKFCTATLIAPQRVLTAAHCIVGDDNMTPRPVEQVQALVGRRSLLNTAQGERRNVTGIAVHPQVNLPQTGVHTYHAFYDVAVLFLESPVSIPPATIGTASDWGKWATAMGWGHTNYDHDNPVNEPHLKAADFVLMSDRQCAYQFDDAVQHYYPTIHVCADDAPGGYLDCITHGDSGGPLMVSSGGSWKLIGVTSFYPSGDGPCGAGGPFGFAWVAGPEISSWPLTVEDPSGQEGTDTGLDLSITRAEVRGYIRTMIRDNTNGRIRRLKSRCSLATYRSMRCGLRWRIGRRAYKAKGEFWHYEEEGEAYWTYVFRGTRRTIGCRGCVRRWTW